MWLGPPTVDVRTRRSWLLAPTVGHSTRTARAKVGIQTSCWYKRPPGGLGCLSQRAGPQRRPYPDRSCCQSSCWSGAVARPHPQRPLRRRRLLEPRRRPLPPRRRGRHQARRRRPPLHRQAPACRDRTGASARLPAVSIRMAARHAIDSHAGTGRGAGRARSAGRIRCPRERLGNRSAARAHRGVRPGVARRAVPGRAHRLDATRDSRGRCRARRCAGPLDANRTTGAAQRAIVVVVGGSP